MKNREITGFIIVSPDPKHWLYWTFSPTAGEAWHRWMGNEVADIERSRSYHIQKWHDKGYRLRESTLTIHMGEDEKP